MRGIAVHHGEEKRRRGDGQPGAPGSELITPRVVDPVVPSVLDVAWFDIDLTEDDIVIESGSFYIGWRQLTGVNNNQVGFDTNGTRYHRTWGNLLDMWFNLEDMLIDGNIMIRALVSEPGQFGGLLPDAAGAAPFYTSDENPASCATMDAADALEAVKLISPKKVVPCHYNASFLWIKNVAPVDEQLFKREVEKMGIECIVMKSGDEILV